MKKTPVFHRWKLWLRRLLSTGGAEVNCWKKWRLSTKLWYKLKYTWLPMFRLRPLFVPPPRSQGDAPKNFPKIGDPQVTPHFWWEMIAFWIQRGRCHSTQIMNTKAISSTVITGKEQKKSAVVSLGLSPSSDSKEKKTVLKMAYQSLKRQRSSRLVSNTVQRQDKKIARTDWYKSFRNDKHSYSRNRGHWRAILLCLLCDTFCGVGDI